MCVCVPVTGPCGKDDHQFQVQQASAAGGSSTASAASSSSAGGESVPALLSFQGTQSPTFDEQIIAPFSPSL